MDSQTVKSIVVLTIVFGTGVVIAVSLFWMDYFALSGVPVTSLPGAGLFVRTIGRRLYP